MNKIEWHSYAKLDVKSRLAKAKKIECILRQFCTLDGLRVLDIGTGAGIIASHMSKSVGKRGRVVAVDVIDQLQVEKGFCFVKVSGPDLPFEDGSFDVVISNMVLEHVGPPAKQVHHLEEIYRVLCPNGLAYLGAPNRWGIIEPHFKLPLLNWLPRRWRSVYVRIVRKGNAYDCEPLSYAEFKKMVKTGGFSYVDCTLDAMQIMRKLEKLNPIMRVLLSIPKPLSTIMRPLIPTMIFVAKR